MYLGKNLRVNLAFFCLFVFFNYLFAEYYKVTSYRIYQYIYIDIYIQDTIQVFQIWHNLCSELTSM
jgi:hypothetical protein